MARRFGKTFCAVGIVIATIVIICISMYQGHREGVHTSDGRGHSDSSCSACPPSPIDICLSNNTDRKMQRLNPNCKQNHGSDTHCPNSILPAGLGGCASHGCARTWIRAALGKTIGRCFQAKSKLRIGISPKCKRCMGAARQASNDHLMHADGAPLAS
jgi:hypothetical protein